MPIYEFECQNCKIIAEKLKNISDDSEEICEKCNQKMQKLISDNSFSLKGDGWFKHGYSKKKNSKV